MQQFPLVPVGGTQMRLACVIALASGRLTSFQLAQMALLCFPDWKCASLDARFEPVTGSNPSRFQFCGYSTQLLHVPLSATDFQRCEAAAKHGDGTDLAPLLGSALVQEYGVEVATQAVNPQWQRIRMVTTPLGLGSTRILAVAVVVAEPSTERD